MSDNQDIINSLRNFQTIINDIDEKIEIEQHKAQELLKERDETITNIKTEINNAKCYEQIDNLRRQIDIMQYDYEKEENQYEQLCIDISDENQIINEEIENIFENIVKLLLELPRIKHIKYINEFTSYVIFHDVKFCPNTELKNLSYHVVNKDIYYHCYQNSSDDCEYRTIKFNEKICETNDKIIERLLKSLNGEEETLNKIKILNESLKLKINERHVIPASEHYFNIKKTYEELCNKYDELVYKQEHEIEEETQDIKKICVNESTIVQNKIKELTTEKYNAIQNIKSNKYLSMIL